MNAVARRRSAILCRVAAAAFLSVALVVSLAGTATASAQEVTSTADTGPGTLRYAVTNAVNGANITFAPNLSGATITLASTLIINANLTIDASALAGGILINGKGSVEIFDVASASTVWLNSLIITNGFNGTNGAGIQNYGVLTLTNCILSGNNSANGRGGAIANNNGTLTLNGCRLSNNSAYYNGGAIFNSLGTVTLTQCVLSGNDTAEYFGGCIYNDSAVFGAGGYVNAGSLTLNQCTLSGNISNKSTKGTEGGAGGGIYNIGPLTLNQCTLSGNSASGSFGGAGGIYNDWGTLTLNQCTVSGNTGYDAGGIYNDGGTGILDQCTISGNTASLAGGGLENSFGTATLINTIVAGNTGSAGADIFVSSNLVYVGVNVVQSVYQFNNEGTISGPSPLTNAPDLAPLGNYGGLTPTMPPLPGSPAIGAGSVAANIFTVDQRGYPRTQNGLIDIGAVELPTVPPFSASPTNVWQTVPVQFNAPVADSDGSAISQWNWSFGDSQTSAAENPAHAYRATGIFSPGLTVTNSLGLTLAATGPVITVYPPLTVTGMSLSGTNLTLKGANSIFGLTYSVLAGTNLVQPLSQWTPLTTNTWNGNGNFMLIVTNALNPSVPKRFYLFKVP
jgi:hypothetical protein